MELIPLTSDHAFYPSFERLLEQAFPPEERRSAAEQKGVVDTNAHFHPCALVENGGFIGLLTYWRGPGFAYIEHFATDPAVRGRGLGKEALLFFLARVGCPVVLEVEPPVDELRERRIGFYERNGFKLWKDSSYVQPPYQKGMPAIELLLMAHGLLDERADFDCLRSWIHKEVYGQSEPIVR